jgi:hypothetical protein
MFTSSNGAGIWITLAAIVCLCIGGGGLVGFLIMSKANKKKRAAGDREAYLKNDFIERQPVYHEVPGQLAENEPMMSKKESNYEYQASEYVPAAPMAPQLQPTQSFPVQQVELAPMTVDPNAVTFPGLPPLGTGGASLLQQTIAAPASAPQYFAQPQAASMNVSTMPYGNYTTNSTYINAGSMYQQAMPQLGQTTTVGTVQMQPQQYAAGGVI